MALPTATEHRPAQPQTAPHTTPAAAPPEPTLEQMDPVMLVRCYYDEKHQSLGSMREAALAAAKETREAGEKLLAAQQDHGELQPAKE